MPTKIYLERRQDRPRLPVHMEARIISASGGPTVPCIVREISPAGARLDVDEHCALGKAFSLCIVGDSCSHLCTIVWREGTSVGIQFATGQTRAWWGHAQSLRMLTLRPLNEMNSLRTRPSFRDEFHPLRRAPGRTKTHMQGKHFAMSELPLGPFGTVRVFSRQRKKPDKRVGVP